MSSNKVALNPQKYLIAPSKYIYAVEETDSTIRYSLQILLSRIFQRSDISLHCISYADQKQA